MGGCQKYGPFLGTLNIRCRIIVGTQKRDPNIDNHPYSVWDLRPYDERTWALRECTVGFFVRGKVLGVQDVTSLVCSP